MKAMSIVLAGTAPQIGKRIIPLEGLTKVKVGSATTTVFTYESGETISLTHASLSNANHQIVLQAIETARETARLAGPDASGLVAYVGAQPAAGFTVLA